MSRVLIDTNAYSALMSGDGTIADELAKHEAILLSPIVIAELYDGFLNGSRNLENRHTLGRFREKPRNPVRAHHRRHRRLVRRDQADFAQKRPSHSDKRRMDRCQLHGARRAPFKP